MAGDKPSAPLSKGKDKGGKPPIWKNIGPRALSAVLFASICTPPIYLGGYVWALLVLVLGLRLVFEWVRMSDSQGGMAAMAIPMIGLLIAVGYEAGGYSVLAAISLGGAALAAGLERARRGGVLWSALGALYVSVPAVLMIAIRGHEAGLSSGFKVMLFIIIVVVAADVGAYLGGSAMKGPKIAPKLSPNKTWSGFGAGMMLGCLFGLLLGGVMGIPTRLSLLLSIVIGVFSVIGDFLESGLKRHFKVKDTGNIIPGHGGLLDRVDGLILAVAASSVLLWVAPQLWTMN